MSPDRERSEYQTRQVELWLMNDEPSYLAYMSRLRKRGKFSASAMKQFVINLWGNRTPDNGGISRVKWSIVAETINSDLESI